MTAVEKSETALNETLIVRPCGVNTLRSLSFQVSVISSYLLLESSRNAPLKFHTYLAKKMLPRLEPPTIKVTIKGETFRRWIWLAEKRAVLLADDVETPSTRSLAPFQPEDARLKSRKYKMKKVRS